MLIIMTHTVQSPLQHNATPLIFHKNQEKEETLQGTNAVCRVQNRGPWYAEGVALSSQHIFYTAIWP